MPKALSPSLHKLAKKGASLAALASLFSSLLTFSAALPASAAAASLTAVSSTISNSKRSACNNINSFNNPEYTNISYTWKLGVPLDFTGSGCINSAGGCITMKIVTDDSNVTSHEQWAPTVTSTDITYAGPANSYVISATPTDENADNANALETLTVVIGCTADCSFVTSTAQTMDIVNAPMATPYAGLVLNPNYYTSYKEVVNFKTFNDAPNTEQSGQTVNNYGPNLNITASVDARVGFNFQGKDAVDDTFYTEDSGSFVDSTDSACEFGTISPAVPKVCLWDLNISTNAANGYKIFVVQDQNMTFNGNTVKQFNNGTRVDDAAATTWSSPSLNAQGHLGYSSNDTSVFPPSSGNAVWAGVPTMVTAGQAASNPAGLVADSNSPGDATYIYALKIESNTTLPQAPAALSQKYSHNELFIVVGNF